jgi:hypothetical protein
LARKVSLDVTTLALTILGICLFLAFGVSIDYIPANAARSDLRKLNTGQSVSIQSLHVSNLESTCGTYLTNRGVQRRRFLTRREGTWVEAHPADWQAPVHLGEYATTLNDSWASCEGTTGKGHSTDFVTIPILILLLNVT